MTVDLLINGQVIFLGRVESTKYGTYNGIERVNTRYVTVFIIDVTQRNLIMEAANEMDIHPCKIMDLRHTRDLNQNLACVKCYRHYIERFFSKY